MAPSWASYLPPVGISDASCSTGGSSLANSGHLGAILGSSWGLWGHLGSSWRHLEHLIFPRLASRMRDAQPGEVLWQTRVILPPSWAHLGGVGVILGPSWGHLGAILGILSSPGWHLGCKMLNRGKFLGKLGSSWRHLGLILGPFWGHLGAIWASRWSKGGPKIVPKIFKIPTYLEPMLGVWFDTQ